MIPVANGTVGVIPKVRSNLSRWWIGALTDEPRVFHGYLYPPHEIYEHDGRHLVVIATSFEEVHPQFAQAYFRAVESRTPEARQMVEYMMLFFSQETEIQYFYQFLHGDLDAYWYEDLSVDTTLEEELDRFRQGIPASNLPNSVERTPTAIGEFLQDAFYRV